MWVIVFLKQHAIPCYHHLFPATKNIYISPETLFFPQLPLLSSLYIYIKKSYQWFMHLGVSVFVIHKMVSAYEIGKHIVFRSSLQILFRVLLLFIFYMYQSKYLTQSIFVLPSSSEIMDSCLFFSFVRFLAFSSSSARFVVRSLTLSSRSFLSWRRIK